MDEIKSVGVVICLLMVLMAYLKQAIPRGKTTYLMKAIISIFVLLSILDGVIHFNFNAIKDLVDRSYSRNEEVWDNAAELVADGLQREFDSYIQNQGIRAEVAEIQVDGNQDTFEIKKVILSGTEAETARNLLAGRYQIGIAYIEVKNE